MEVYLSLGSNVGDRLQTIISAIEELQKHPKIFDLKASRMYLTEPYGLAKQPDFINCAVRIETVLSARDILQEINIIEKDFGRRREIRWGARTLDIDILFFGNQVIQEPDLIIPHPQIHKRAFILQPLHELCPDLVHPVLHKTVRTLLENLTDNVTLSHR
ncbi:MAG: 2-amino-4-hydroxy-6-hydroxymethyldihydropteridine diphosphokinase [Candidatus Cloacimonetes bacterium]|nr:2-amino-4-hydroxy-6-hydroxymethyldihydropteridine diphosphokinase [Candidatus Cloacimonadota bacterium]